MDQSTKLELDDLVVRLLKGESELIQAIMELLGGPVYAFFVRLDVPVADAPDVVAEFFHELFDRKIWHYEPQAGSTFWSWLCVVILNRARDWHKKAAGNLEIAASDYIEIADGRSALVAQRITPPSKRMRSVLEAFEVAFAALNTTERDLMRLKEVVGLEYDQIAEIFQPGIAADRRKQLANRLKTTFHRAKEKVRKLMKADPRVPRDFFEGESKGEVIDVESEWENQHGVEPGA